MFSIRARLRQPDMSAADGDLLQRIRRDLADSYDEDLEYGEVAHPAIVLPPRVRHDDYARKPVPSEILVPEVL